MMGRQIDGILREGREKWPSVYENAILGELYEFVGAVLAATAAPPTAAAAVEAVPGFKLVPVEPTDEMIYMMTRAIANRAERVDSYKAMLAAAPAVPVEAQPTKLDLTLTQADLGCIAEFLGDNDAEQDDEMVRLLIGPGHSGYGLYAAHPEYPEEGAVFVKPLSEAQPVARVGSPSMGEGRGA